MVGCSGPDCEGSSSRSMRVETRWGEDGRPNADRLSGVEYSGAGKKRLSGIVAWSHLKQPHSLPSIRTGDKSHPLIDQRRTAAKLGAAQCRQSSVLTIPPASSTSPQYGPRPDTCSHCADLADD
ncbi:hypothetical protein EYF80_013798 [Liparis tanakae]|uniref:Uncharacterized protein n=1 Tax=Liparis tanakae TaxID=230148 RepID=A0A4Z2IEM2_9TELE|nr:hypothetical protein EYF80_013798 [Liparis tanakae]